MQSDMSLGNGHRVEILSVRLTILFVVGMVFYSITPLYAGLPWLHADGNRIKDPAGNVVVLRGVDLIDIGFLEEWQGGVINMIDALTDPCDPQGNYTGWNTRVLRLAIVPADADGAGSWPNRFDPGNNDFYNTILRPAVDYCASKGVYAIIDWHYVDDTFAHVETTSAFWEYMAPRFANDSHVIFELYNEPINNVGNDTNDWLSVRTDMQTWIDIVRTYAPNNLILVAGASYSQIIGPAATYPVSDPVGSNNIAYVSHLYPGHWLNQWLSSWYKNNVTTCAAVHPVFMSEWGFSQSSSEPGELGYGTITNYGQPIMNWVEGMKISSTSWVASYDWSPAMFLSNYTLRCGEGEMGCFVKDTLYLRRNDDQPDTTPPAAPAGLAATAGGGVISLDWNDNGESDLDGYNVYRSTSSGSGYTRINDSLLSSSEYTDNYVSHMLTYYYVVTAVDIAANESGVSYEDSATLNDGSFVQLSFTDFETDMGDWVNVTGDDTHDWTRDSGGTPSSGTGPNSGANGSTWYVYFETSSGSGAYYAGETAYLEGPETDAFNRQLTFYYHMYGEDIGTLNVDVFDGSWHNDIWNLSGQQHSSSSDEYTQAIVDLSTYTGPIRIRFRAVAAGGAYGDMAIDDIEINGQGALYGDFNEDNTVDIDDIPAFLGYWLVTDCNDIDLNDDCLINLYEFSELAKNWLK
ncbi:MAG: cellulase family glycosylhydrolase [Sedimentisphaerales bacterium]|nr:cellulase family glycosylhydrolase [Sedimentisphaerales bacterium]